MRAVLILAGLFALLLGLTSMGSAGASDRAMGPWVAAAGAVMVLLGIFNPWSGE